MTDRKISRRHFAMSTVAGLTLPLALNGCENTTPPSSSPSTGGSANRNNGLPDEISLGDVPPFKDQGKRLYLVRPAVENLMAADIWETLNPKPIPVTGIREGFEKKYPDSDFVLWATESEANTLKQHPAIESVDQKSDSDLCDIGDPNDKRAILCVRFLPNSEWIDGSVTGYASIDQIVDSWRKATRDIDGLVINPGTSVEAQPAAAVMNIPDPNQVVIRFSSPSLNPEVLKMVRRHPQTMYLQWGAVFTTFYCPPCGMG